MKVEAIVLADLSGIGNASGHPVKWSIMVRMCLFPDVEVSHQKPNLLQSYQKAYQVFSSFEGGNFEFWLSPCGIRPHFAMYLQMSVFIPFQ